MVLLRCGVLLLALTVARAAEPLVIPLWPEGVPGLKANAGPTQDDGAGHYTNIHYPTLTVFPAAKPIDTAVLYTPGGGYIRVAAAADGGEPVKWLNSLGITVFMLKYRHVDYGQPAPLQDVLRAMRIVRSRASEFGVAPNRIGIFGASAGGHVAASAGTMYDAPEGRTGAEIDRVSARPDFMMLLFPVITMQSPFAHAASRRALLGENPSDELRHRWSLEEHVTKDTPPAFLVHSAEDPVVPVENSMMLYAAMRRVKVPIEMHLYTRGGHNSGTDPKVGPTSAWPRLGEAWLRMNGWLPAKP
jgi:acetyl esterase/lipase